MSSKTTLNAKNLEALGAERLAELLIEISTGSALAKRRLRLELAGAQSPDDAGRAVAKRLISITRSRSTISWKSRKTLVLDLQTQLEAIRDQIAPADPAQALDLMWRFLHLASSVFDRCDDRTGTVIGVFQQASAVLGQIAVAAGTPTKGLVDAVIYALADNGHGQFDGLIGHLAPALGVAGLAQLKARLDAMAATPVPIPPRAAWKAVGYGIAGSVYAHQVQDRAKDSMLRMALKELADAMGDVEAFVSQHDNAARRQPQIAAEIAQRLLAANRAEEALAAIDSADVHAHAWAPDEWIAARLQVLEALGRTKDAQAFRLACFHRNLSPVYLRAYLQRLPDFEDIEAEDRAMAYAMAYPAALQGLAFLIAWPAPDHAARLILSRLAEVDGNHYEILSVVAEALSQNHPLAATLVLRAMIDFALNAGRAGRYPHAARHLQECAVLAQQIADYGGHETHAAYVVGLRRDHARKAGFWGHLA